MDIFTIISQFIFLVFLSTFLLKNSIPYLSKYLIDKPNARSSHKIATPNGGGIIIVILGIPFLYFQGFVFAIFTIPLAFISLIDDIKKVDYKIRLLIQGFCVACIYSQSNLHNIFTLKYSSLINTLIAITLVFLGTGFINLVNFMDGLDSLLGTSMMIIIGVISLKTAPHLLPFLGIILGFLYFNWPPAKVFMGDVGSTFLGAICLGLILNSNEIYDFFLTFLLTAPILGDALITVIVRSFKKQTLFKPHRLHLFQRLQKAGWNHLKVSLVYSILTSVSAITYFFFDLKVFIIITFLEFLLGFCLNSLYAIPINKRENCT